MSKIPLPTRQFYFLACSLLILLGLVIYYQTFSFGFVFDDEWFIVTNPDIRSFYIGWDEFIKLPLTRILGFFSFAFNYSLGGLDPKGYHIFNFLVHLTAVGLVWAISSKLFKLVGQASRELPLLIAVLFLVHPCQTQAVTYVTQRFESMATVFYLGTFYSYLSARLATSDSQRNIFFVLAALLAILGIMTKEVVVTIPFMLLAAELFILPSVSKKSKIYGFLIAGGAVFSLLFIQLVRTGFSMFSQVIESDAHDGDLFTFENYFLTQMRVFLTFLRLLVFPVHQNLDYDYPMSTGLLHPPLTLVGVILIGAMIYFIVRLRRQLPLVSLGLAWILIAFSINLVPRPNVIFEHKLYLISFGFFLAMVAALSALMPSRKIVVGIIAMIVLVLSVLSYQRNQVWKDDLTLWQDVIHKSPNKERPNINLALSLMKVNRYSEALVYLNKFMKPANLKSHLARGDIYFQAGDYDLALEDFNKVISKDPKNADAYIRRAKVYKRQNNYEAALADLKQAITLEPTNEKPYIDRAIIWMAEARPDDAMQDLQQALRLDPHNYGALINYAGVCFVLKRYDEAIEYLNQADVVNPHDSRTYKNRAMCYRALGRTKEADADEGRMREEQIPHDLP